jgi:hypothetical protein
VKAAMNFLRAIDQVEQGSVVDRARFGERPIVTEVGHRDYVFRRATKCNNGARAAQNVAPDRASAVEMGFDREPSGRQVCRSGTSTPLTLR